MNLEETSMKPNVHSLIAIVIATNIAGLIAGCSSEPNPSSTGAGGEQMSSSTGAGGNTSGSSSGAGGQSTSSGGSGGMGNPDDAMPSGPSDMPKAPANWASVMPKSRIRTVGFAGPPGSTQYATRALAYADCVSGDYLVLPDGVQTGNWTLDRSFATNNPVIITSRNMTDAKTPGSSFTGKITVSGKGHWLHQLTTAYKGSSRHNADIDVTGTYCYVSRCWIQGREGINVSPTGQYVAIGWNRFTGRNSFSPDSAGTNVSHTYVEFPVDYPNPDAGPRDIYIYRNFYWDDVDHSGFNTETGGESMHVYFGDAKVIGNDEFRMTNVLVEENYFEGDSANKGRPRSIYSKRGMDAFRNHSKITNGIFGARHGWGFRYWGNRVGSTMQIIGDPRAANYAEGTDLRNNVASRFNLVAGSDFPSRQAATYVTLYLNAGPVVRGFAFAGSPLGQGDTGVGDGKVRHIRIYDHVSGSITDHAAANVDTSTFIVDANNPMGLSEGRATIPATFGHTDTGFEVPKQGL